jgi:hypothetical protein
MSTVSSPAALPKHIEQLLSDRSAHVAAVATIDATIARVTAALGGTASVAPAPKPVAATKVAAKTAKAKPPVVKAVAAKAPVAKAPVTKAPVARAAKSGLTASEFIIEFIKAKKNPTSQEINKHWKDAGRNGMADNNLSLLTKAKTLKRVPLGPGLRGSRYSVA